MKNKEHEEIRNKIENLLGNSLSIEEIAKQLQLSIGTRHVKGSAKWYKYCIVAKRNQKKAIEKHPNLYSKAGKIAQEKHHWIGKKLGKKYGPIQGKKNMERLKGNSEHFSMMAKKLQEINPNFSRENMKKAHETMKKKGTFNEHQKLAALKCMEKNPKQLKEMSDKAHKLYPLALLALESRRKNYPYEFMGCLFDSEQEREIGKKLIGSKLIEKPIEKVNTHFRIGKCHIDFFIQNKIFLEFHPVRKFGRKIETVDDYNNERRKLLDENGFKNHPLIVINNLKEANEKIKQIESMLHLL
ncbi:hypothetical protein COV15_02935 [Candidatus Woesearchaeota archaeon CG10_big_fil_rev_8_21_14_0_10_34_12]|nr:MAG: hypothetical protein COV15_02935 [Candidatus Woesearchaeota archaeon CG10_big_fil_rev_8_21_14_0_10_34_12]